MVDLHNPRGQRGEPIRQSAIWQKTAYWSTVVLLARLAVASAARYRRNAGVLECSQQTLLPPGAEDHVVIEEADDPPAHPAQCLVAGASHPSREFRCMNVVDGILDAARKIDMVGRGSV